MISSDVIRGYNDTMILCLLLEGDSYGYELSKQIRSRTAERYIIKETTLYSALSRLERGGFIESYSAGEESGGKHRTYFRTTDQGRQYYAEKCGEWHLTKEVIDQFIKEQNDGDN